MAACTAPHARVRVPQAVSGPRRLRPAHVVHARHIAHGPHQGRQVRRVGELRACRCGVRAAGSGVRRSRRRSRRPPRAMASVRSASRCGPPNDSATRVTRHSVVSPQRTLDLRAPRLFMRATAAHSTRWTVTTPPRTAKPVTSSGGTGVQQPASRTVAPGWSTTTFAAPGGSEVRGVALRRRSGVPAAGRRRLVGLRASPALLLAVRRRRAPDGWRASAGWRSGRRACGRGPATLWRARRPGPGP